MSSHNSQLFVLLFAVFLLPASTWRPAVTVNTGCLAICYKVLASAQCTTYQKTQCSAPNKVLIFVAGSSMLIAVQCLKWGWLETVASVHSLLISISKTQSPGQEIERRGCVRFFKPPPIGEVSWSSDLPLHICRTFHRMADQLTLVPYLSSFVRRSFRHWDYLNVRYRSWPVK